MRRGRGGKLLANAALALASLVVAAAAAEVGLRWFLPESTSYFVFAPHEVRVLDPLPEHMPGVTGTSEFRTNALGIRGDELGADGSEYRILAMGGSTSLGAYLDQSEAWPLLVGALLGPTADGRETWSGTVGRSGATTRTNVVQFRYLLPSLPPMDVVVMLLGANDLSAALREGWSYRPPPPLGDPVAEGLRMRQAFVRVPGRLHDQFPGYRAGKAPLHKRLALYHLARLGRDAWVMAHGGLRQDRFGAIYATWRRHRREATIVHDSLPPLGGALAEYEAYLESIVDMAARYGVRLVFLTQPVLWSSDPTPAEEALLWMGGTGDFQTVPGQAYFGAGALAEGMDAFNATLREVCVRRAVECVDLAREVPPDASMFYDDVHPTELGSRTYARLLAAHLRERPPYSTTAAGPR